MEEILQERAEEVQREMAGEENQESLEVVPEEIEVVVEKGENAHLSSSFRQCRDIRIITIAT